MIKCIQLDILPEPHIQITSPRELTIMRWKNKKNVNDFLNKYHYLGWVQGWKYAFAIKYKEYVVGCAVFSRPVARLEDQEDTLELRRFVLLDECPRNSESYILGQLLKLLKREGWKRFISYSDLEQGHSGIIYKATNWKCLGVVGGADWRNRRGRVCEVGRHKKLKWELICD